MLCRNATAALFALALAAASSGCQLSTLFDLNRDVQIDETHSQSVDLLLRLNLAEGLNLGEGREARLSAFTLDSADVTVSQIDTAAGTNDVRALSGRLWLRPDGATDDSGDVLVGAIEGLALQKGATARLAGTAEAGAMLLAAHRKSGRFQAVVNLSMDGGRAAHVVLWISLHATAGYATP